RLNLVASQVNPAHSAPARAESMPQPFMALPARDAKPFHPVGRNLQPQNDVVFGIPGGNRFRLHMPNCSWQEKKTKLDKRAQKSIGPAFRRAHSRGNED